MEDIVEYIIGLSRKRYMGVYIGNIKAVLPEAKIILFYIHSELQDLPKNGRKIRTGRTTYTNLEFCR